MAPDRLPPQDIDTESACLAAVLLNREALFRVTEILQPEDFYLERYRTIFQAITELEKKNLPVDLATLKQKLGADFRRYTILGACNPPLAHRGLTGNPFFGLFLPCNVVIFERDEGGSVISIGNPRELFLKVLADPPPEALALIDEVDARVRRALDRI